MFCDIMQIFKRCYVYKFLIYVYLIVILIEILSSLIWIDFFLQVSMDIFRPRLRGRNIMLLLNRLSCNLWYIFQSMTMSNLSHKKREREKLKKFIRTLYAMEYSMIYENFSRNLTHMSVLLAFYLVHRRHRTIYFHWNFTCFVTLQNCKSCRQKRIALNVIKERSPWIL